MKLADIISGGFILDKDSKKNLRYAAYILLFVMISIWLSHSSDRQARYEYRLRKENRKLKSEYVALKSQLMKKQLRSEVYKKIKDKGFIIPKRRPVKIIVKK